MIELTQPPCALDDAAEAARAQTAVRERRYPAPQHASVAARPLPDTGSPIREAQADRLVRRAALLADQGDDAGAQGACLEALSLDPGHLDALTNLGRFLIQNRDYAGARIVLQRAVELHPTDLASRVSLGVLHYEMQDLPAAERELTHALLLDPEDAIANAALAFLHQGRGDTHRANQHRGKAFNDRSLIRLPYHGHGEPVRVLYLTSSEGSNAPLDAHLDDTVFQTTILLPEFHPESAPLPDHDLIVMAVGDADSAPAALRSAQAIIARSAAPVVNATDRVAACSRYGIPEQLAGIPGVRSPAGLRLPKAALLAAGAAHHLAGCGFTYPLLLRATGLHGGDHLYRVDDAADLALTAEHIPTADVLVIEYVDTCSRDGRYRKYRVLSIGGTLHPIHLITGDDWKLRAARAHMDQSSRDRLEERRFLTSMAGTLGASAMQALERVAERLGLDYAGIDFAMDAEGTVVVFEANPAMTAIDPPQGSPWQARREAAARARATLQAMLLDKARSILQARHEAAQRPLRPAITKPVSLPAH